MKIYVDGRTIRENAENATNRPVVCLLDGELETKGHEIVLRVGEQEVAKVVYRRFEPLSGGQLVWVEPSVGVTVEVINHEERMRGEVDNNQ